MIFNALFSVKSEIENEDPNPRIYWLGSGEQAKVMGDVCKSTVYLMRKKIFRVSQMNYESRSSKSTKKLANWLKKSKEPVFNTLITSNTSN